MAATLFHLPTSRVIDSNGIADGATLTFYDTGTLNKRSVYTTSALSVAHPNPLTVAAGAAVPSIYLDDTYTYRCIVKDSGGATIDDIDPYTGFDATSFNFTQAGTGAVDRTAQAKMRDIISVLDFGADSTGATNATTAFHNAFAAAGGGVIAVPDGTFLVDADAMKLDASGTRWVGVSKYGAVIKAAAGTTGALCRNTGSASTTSAYGGVENLRFDLNGEACTAVDLSSVNNTVVRDCFFDGGYGFSNATTTSGSAVVTLTGTGGNDTTRLKAGQTVYGANIPAGTTILTVDSSTQFTMTANATSTLAGTAVIYCVAGTAVKFNAPLASGAYTNEVANCAGQYLATGVDWGAGANENHVTNSEWTGCGVGLSPYNATTAPDSPRIVGGRVEGCNIGVQSNALGLTATGLRCEASNTADVKFLTGAQQNSFVGCLTASSTANFSGAANCAGLLSKGGNFEQWETEPSVSLPTVNAKRQTFAAAGSATALQTTPANATPGVSNYAGYFYDPLFLRNGAGTIEFINATNDNTVIGLTVDGSNRVTLSGYDRKAAAYTRVFVGDVFSFNPGTGLDYAGVQVLSSRKTGWAADTGTAKRTANATYSGTAEAAYTQATIQTLMNEVRDLSQTVKALKDDLIAHGIIGA